MNAFTSTAAQRESWENRLLDDHCSDDSYGRDPYKYDRKLKQFRDMDSGRLVGKRKPLI